MSTRFYSEAGRIIMSKPGYSASPSTPDDFKIFDSDWQFGYVLIKSGYVSPSGNTATITFPTQHFRPIVEMTFIRRSDGLDYDLGTRADQADSTSSHSVTVGNSVDRVDYVVYGLSL